MKIIILLRNPIERAYSHWNMESSRHNENLSFWDAIKSEELRLNNSNQHQNIVFSYIDREFYLRQLRRIWSFYSKENTLILKSEDLKKDPNKTIDIICNFLKVKHHRSYYREMYIQDPINQE